MGILAKWIRPVPPAVARVTALAPLLASLRRDPRARWPQVAEGLRGRWNLWVDAVAVLAELWLLRQPPDDRVAMLDDLVGRDPGSWTLLRAHLHWQRVLAARAQGASAAGCARAAADDIDEALRLDPVDPAPCVLAMMLGREIGAAGLCMSMHFEGLRRAPGCYALHAAHSAMISAARGGSHARQLEHAREIAEAAPAGGLVGALPIEAWFSQLAFLLEAEGDRAGMHELARRPHVLAEVRDACARSVLHAAHEVTPTSYELRTKALVIALLGDDRALVRTVWPALDGVYVDAPWRRLVLDPTATFVDLQRLRG